MTEIKIMPIQDLLRIPNLFSAKQIMIVFVTTNHNYYYFGDTWFFHLDIADIDAPIIKKEDIFDLKRIIGYANMYNTIYVCCDAGLSRSPAVAYFIATKLGMHKRALEIDDKYQFLNVALFKKLMVKI